MYEYRVVEVRSVEKAEEVMNQMAKYGWRVVAKAHYYTWGHLFFITFEREVRKDNDNEKVKF